MSPDLESHHIDAYNWCPRKGLILENSKQKSKTTINAIYDKVYSEEKTYNKILGEEYIDFCIILDSLKSLSKIIQKSMYSSPKILL